jgi:hypothetical protein
VGYCNQVEEKLKCLRKRPPDGDEKKMISNGVTTQTPGGEPQGQML